MEQKTSPVFLVPSMEDSKHKDFNIYCILSLAVLCLLTALIFGCRRDSSSTTSMPSKDIPTIISYPDQPADPSTKLLFTEDMRIHHEGWWPQSVLIDSNDRIMVPTYRENRIYIFDQAGHDLETLEFPAGQGPGEFSAMEPQLSPNGDFYIYDRRQQRLTIMDAKGREAKTILKFGEMRQVFTLGPLGEYYFWVVHFRPGTKDAQDLILTRFDSKGSLVREYESHPFAPVRTDRSGKRIYKLYDSYGMFKLDPAGNLYAAISDTYEITVYSPEGLPLRKIIKKTQPRGPDEKDLEIIRPFFSEFPTDQTVLLPPSQMPEIADILILSDSSLLVVTFDPSKDSMTLSADWFNPEGRFLNRVQIPKYYLWFKAFGPGVSHARIAGDYFYAIAPTDETENDFVVKRYKIQQSN
jgi:hypothetical protein